MPTRPWKASPATGSSAPSEADRLCVAAAERAIDQRTGSVHRRTMVVFMVLAVMALGACSLARGPAPVRESAEIADGPVCRMPYQAVFLGLTLPDELVPQVESRAGVVPEDFRPVSAVMCGEVLTPSVSAELTTTFTETHWSGDFSRAVERLNASSEGRRIDQDSCPVASSVPLPDLWLVDERGRALRPSYPVDECGFQQIGGLREVETLELADTVTHTVHLRPDQVQEWMGCGIETTVPVVGDRAIEPGTYSLNASVCRYTSDGSGAVSFDGADQLHESLDGALDGLLPAPACLEVATSTVDASISFYNSESSTPQPVHVELDGCRRILIAGFEPLSATPATIAHFS